MRVEHIKTICFSATHTTKTIVAALAAGMEIETTELDLTYPEYDAEIVAAEGEISIIGAPVYAGRVAPLALERMKYLQGNGTPAIAVVLYGNREYEDALLELRDFLTSRNFQVVAGCAFIGEHSFSTGEYPIAHGRPDNKDIALAKEFGKKVIESVTSTGIATDELLEVPGNSPYKAGFKKTSITTQVNQELCSQCGTCVATCPAGAISLDEEIVMDGEKCILCCACVKNCPENAVAPTAAPFVDKVKWLSENLASRKEPVLFL
jgi:ferredoxin